MIEWTLPIEYLKKKHRDKTESNDIIKKMVPVTSTSGNSELMKPGLNNNNEEDLDEIEQFIPEDVDIDLSSKSSEELLIPLEEEEEEDLEFEQNISDDKKMENLKQQLALQRNKKMRSKNKHR